MVRIAIAVGDVSSAFTYNGWFHLDKFTPEIRPFAGRGSTWISYSF